MIVTLTREETPRHIDITLPVPTQPTSPDESTPSSTVSPETSDETTIFAHQETTVPVITNSILRVTDRCNKHAMVPLLTFTINKKVVTVNEGTIASLLQRSVDLMTKFITTGTKAQWDCGKATL